MRGSRAAVLVAAVLLLQLACFTWARPDTQPRDQVLGDLRRSSHLALEDHLALEKTTGNAQAEKSHQHDESPAPVMEQRTSISEEHFSRSSPWSKTGPHAENAAPASSIDEMELEELQTQEDERLYGSYELILARLAEDISWVAGLPEFWEVTVYNKGGIDHPVSPIPGRPLNVVNIPNEGREGETFMHHIISRYDSLADYTVFSQAVPFVHSPNFVDLLSEPQLLGPVQCLSTVYMLEGNPDMVTPQEVVKTYQKHRWYRAERISLRTLDSVYFNDKGAAVVGSQYLDLHHLPRGTNIIAHFLSMVGLPGWIPNQNEVGSFGYGGIFGVQRRKVVQHPIHVYENLAKTLLTSPVHGFVMERAYLMLFGGADIHD